MLTMPLILLALGAATLPLAGSITPAHALSDVAIQATVARDPADSLYKAARDALAQGDYARAAQLFRDVSARYPQSAFAPDALYYEAFARYHSGETDDLQAARALLDTLRMKYPSYRSRGEASVLATRVCGELARQGDASCAATIAAEAQATTAETQAHVAETQAHAAETQAHAAVVAAESQAHVAQSVAQDGDDDQPGCAANDDRVAALNALLQMDADRAMPILEKVLARRDACSASLRRKAVFLVSQKHTPQTVDVLLHIAQTDPDPEVRGQAVFWLSQVHDDRAVQVLSDILRTSNDPSIREKAIFALSQNHSVRARDLLRQYATDASAPKELRGKAIFWLGQDHSAGADAFMQSLYDKLTDADLKDKALFALSQQHEGDNGAWLLGIAKRTGEPLEIRKRALFLAGQGGASTAQIAAFYDALPQGELRDQAVFVLAQRHDPASIDKLISIARSDKDAKARQTAIFWLGQSHDPRATKFLTEIIDK